MAAVTRAAGRPPTAWHRSTGGGYTPAERWLVEFRDGTRAFAKVATTEQLAAWLRVERRAYDEIDGPFMPRVLGWADEPAPVLLLEDLSVAHWPPPWDETLVQRVIETLDVVAATPCPRWARSIVRQTEIFSGWSRVAEDPRPFLTLGLATSRWLDAVLPDLIAHEHPPEVDGTALLHVDVRSDNICFTPDRTVLVDWNWVGRGNPLFDLAAWLPSLQSEGGPAPEDVRGEAGVFAPALAGYFCANAGLPNITDAPHVRRVQLEQATTSLPWAARWLGLPPPDGLRL